MAYDDIRDRITTQFADAGVTGRLHATDLDTGREVGVGADSAVLMASVFKVPLVLALYRAADAGRLDPAAPVTVVPEARTAGPTGIGAMADPVTMSLRDLAHLAVSVSDNAAADALADRVGLDAVADAVAAVGLTATRVVEVCRDVAARTAASLGTEDPARLARLLTDPVALSQLATLDVGRSNRTTARDCTTLLAALWRDTAASPRSCVAIRRLLSLQVWPHRLASGFPFDDVRVAGKTGTLPTVRNEIGVVEYPDGGRYAVAVFTRSAATSLTLPRADAVIGAAARTAVEHLRSARR
ncbi:class A beta-lactamase-related serine hydrolase [Catellatospora sp. KI3]|uniref:serine hydrolase n=1 Tax=Catellatospora sp. KI3 TaxID=3041620 RepID=UPI002482A364|nr:serine hydrolase [Catellatospora sp. KI3]MDI1463382.1 class A beta-lactamase-related serine hydrolase [Catellatospora sp. KI3]